MTKVHFCLSSDIGERNLFNSHRFGVLRLCGKGQYFHILLEISVEINSTMFVCVE